MAGEQKADIDIVMEAMREVRQGRKLGDEHVAAMARLGFKELTQALAAFPDSNVRPLEEPGTVGNAPQYAPGQKSEPTLEQMLNGYAGRVQQPKDNDKGLER